ncbi:complement factor B-like [Synchiropus splendidus]|uniref:complement factor B-like n=1 Tax=Synchiropus splendidus TaxID=270530 RepID=UPI00237D8F85|nr:complement factor B-like [Synchiropus splendidus]
MPSTVYMFYVAALLSLFMGGGVWCDCPSENIGITGGNYTLSKGLVIDSQLVYHCPEGYYPYPEMIRTCQWDNTWTPPFKKSKPQTCRLVECPDPTVLVNGLVLPAQEKYFVGNVTTFECYSGFPLRGSPKRTCLPNGKWSGSTTICSKTTGHRCPDPGVPPGATRSGNSLDTHSNVTYACSGDLLLVGSSKRTCLENGQWTGTEPACYSKFTYDTTLEVTLEFGKSIMNTLTTLEPDKTQTGRTIRISKAGILNIYIAVDISKSIEANEFERAREALLALVMKISSFTVSPNYEIIFFCSKVYEAVDILDFLDNKAQLNTVIQRIKDFEVADKNYGTNLNLAFKTFLEKMGFIKQRVGEERFKEHRHVLILFTDGAYNMGGTPAPTVQRIKEMVYMNPTGAADVPSREEYLDIHVFAVGTNILAHTLQTLTVGLGNKHYYKLKDVRSLQAMFDEIIDESEVKDLCGLHRSYETPGVDGKRKMYPWLAFVYIQREGSSRKCLGSLVTPEFVLTAAHCFVFGDGAEHVTVEIEDGDDKIKPVKQFYIHPNYKVNAKVAEGVAEFYDYDIALIQLEDYVRISPVVRTICIPCTQETSDALHLVGKSTCKQQEELLFQNRFEHLSFLTRTENLVDLKDVHAKLLDERPACIRHALQAKGITTKDPEVAVTDNFLCTGGIVPTRDHIACKGDGGGAVFRSREHRTIQIGVVSWGTTELCEGGGVVDSQENSRDFHINLFKMVPFLKGILGNDNQDDYTPLTFLTE